jgi:CRP-like cAMP-binding protein
VPFCLAFVTKTPPALAAISLLVDAALFTDIILTFFTGFAGDDEIVWDRRAIAKRYFRGWFLLDLISAMPIDLIAQEAGASGGDSGSFRALQALRIARLPRLLRLLRLPRLFRYLQRAIEGDFVSSYSKLRMMNLLLMACLLMHWNACLQYLVPTLEALPDDSWVFAHEPPLDEHVSIGMRYTQSLFRAISQMLCISYGLGFPERGSEVFIALWCMIAGTAISGMLVANLAHILSSVDHASQRYSNALESFNTFVQASALPRELRERARHYLQHQFPTRKLYDKHAVLSMLPWHLQRDISRHSCRHVLQSVPLFQDAEPGFITAASLALVQQTACAGDMLAREGEELSRLIFIERGIVEVLRPASHAEPHITDLGPGSFIGEISVLGLTGPAAHASASVRCVGRCVLQVLHKHDFDAIICRFPGVRAALRSVATRRLERYGTSTSPGKHPALARMRSCSWQTMERLSPGDVEGYIQSKTAGDQTVKLAQNSAVDLTSGAAQSHFAAFRRVQQSKRGGSLRASARATTDGEPWHNSLGGVIARLRRSGERRRQGLPPVSPVPDTPSHSSTSPIGMRRLPSHGNCCRLTSRRPSHCMLDRGSLFARIHVNPLDALRGSGASVYTHRS